MKEFKMKRAILIVLFFGLVVTIAPAQPGPADNPSLEPRYGGYGERGAYDMGDRGRRGEYGVGARTHRLVERWKASNQDTEREKVEADLRTVLKREFTSRLAAHDKEIKDLEEKVRQLRARLALRKEKQDEIVEHRLQQLLRDAQGLGWGSEVTRSESIFNYGETTAPAATSATADDVFTPATDDGVADEVDAAGNPFGEAPSTDSDLAPARN
jgi:hypothetical protein